MKQIVLIIFLSLNFQVLAKKMRPEIMSLVQKIEDYNVLESEHVGITGETTDQYRNFETLRDKASMDVLLELLQYKNSVVKGYASWALADKRYSKPADILAEFIRTGETAMTQDGCIMYESDLASEFYNRVFYQHLYHKLSLKDSMFFQWQIVQLDSVIIYTQTEGLLLRRALSNNKGRPQTYDQVRHLAFDVKNTDAIQALAVYQRKEDIRQFKMLNELGFPAVALFPDNTFWEFLLTYKDTCRSKNYLMAISAFKTEDASVLLSDFISTTEEKDIAGLSEALIKNYCSYYQDLIMTIWEEYKIIDIRATIQIITDIPEEAANSFVIGLLSAKKFQFVEYDYDYGSSGQILPLMLNHIKTYQSDKLVAICEQNIKTARFTALGSFLTFAKDNQMMQVSEEILERLQLERQAYEIFHLTETLLSFNISDNKEKLIPLLRSNRKSWDGGNWSDQFRELFTQYNVDFY